MKRYGLPVWAGPWPPLGLVCERSGGCVSVQCRALMRALQRVCAETHPLQLPGPAEVPSALRAHSAAIASASASRPKAVARAILRAAAARARGIATPAAAPSAAPERERRRVHGAWWGPPARHWWGGCVLTLQLSPRQRPHCRRARSGAFSWLIRAGIESLLSRFRPPSVARAATGCTVLGRTHSGEPGAGFRRQPGTKRQRLRCQPAARYVSAAASPAGHVGEMHPSAAAASR